MDKITSAKDPCSRISDVYIITMLLIFPVFVGIYNPADGIHGYQNITFYKYAFFMAATCAYISALILCVIIKAPRLKKPGLPQYLALTYLAVCLASLLLSGNISGSFSGLGRYDGFLTTAAYAAAFIGISAFGSFKLWHIRLLAVSVSVCCAVAILQLVCGGDLGLFPKGMSYYDANIYYSGAFLGTVGNTNVLDDVLCMAIPAFAAVWITSGELFFLAATLPAAFVTAAAGGDGALLTLAVCALIGAPVLLCSGARLHRALSAAGAASIVSGAAKCINHSGREIWFQPGSAAVFLFALGALMLIAAGAVYLMREKLRARSLRIFIISSEAAGLLIFFTAVYLAPPESGALNELSRLLHGEVSDSFGSSRIKIWRECLALFPERPILGSGPGTLAGRLHVEFSRYVPELGRTRSTYIDNAHNEYLACLINTGLLGLAAYLSFLVSCAVSWLKKRPLNTALGLAVLGYAVHSFFGLGLCISAPVFWIMLGLCCPSMPNGGNDEQTETA